VFSIEIALFAMTKASPQTGAPRNSSGAEPLLQGPDSASEIAAYISQMSADLAALARSAKLGALAYLLEMTEVEAGHAAQKMD